jgi:hypothetical protein
MKKSISKLKIEQKDIVKVEKSTFLTKKPLSEQGQMEKSLIPPVSRWAHRPCACM